MCENWLHRTEILLGKEKIEILKSATVAVMGLGGVGGYVAEALCRSGVGRLVLVDKDRFDLSNLNRQIFSVKENIGKLKVEEAKKRLESINPDIKIEGIPCFIDDETIEQIEWDRIDYCIDAIDTMTSKLSVIKLCQKKKIPVVSCMGTGFRLDPTKIRVDDIYKTSVCPMAKAMRSLMRKEGISECKVVYSLEEPVKLFKKEKMTEGVSGHQENKREEEKEKRGARKNTLIGSLSFVPAAAGFTLASLAVRTLISSDREK